jgi:hypothetical protein
LDWKPLDAKKPHVATRAFTVSELQSLTRLSFEALLARFPFAFGIHQQQHLFYAAHTLPLNLQRGIESTVPGLTCTLSTTCRNPASISGICSWHLKEIGVRISPAGDKGLGVFALRRQRAGCEIARYDGFPMSQAEVKEQKTRFKARAEKEGVELGSPASWWNTNLFETADPESMDADEDSVIFCGSSSTSCLARYVNEARGKERGKANARLEHSLDGELWIVLTRDVERGAEILLESYNTKREAGR